MDALCILLKYALEKDEGFSISALKKEILAAMQVRLLPAPAEKVLQDLQHCLLRTCAENTYPDAW